MKIIKLILILGIFITLNAKIIEVQQLFNKSLVKVKKEEIKESKVFYGNTNFDETKVYDINLRFDGFIKNLLANEEHKYIKKGQKLFSIYSKEVVSTFEELLLSNKFQKEKSFSNSIESKLELLDVKRSIISNVKKSKKIKYYIDIYSPASGLIVNKKINDGGFVKAGQNLFSLVDISTLWINAKVYQDDLSFITNDMQVKVDIQGHKSINTKVDFIHPFVNTKTKTIDVRVKIQNKDLRIYPNMFAKLEFYNVKKSMLILPKSAVITKGDNHFVFKPISKTEFEPILVTAKRISSNKFEVISGLGEGDTVINNALFMLDSDAITNGLYETDEDEDW